MQPGQGGHGPQKQLTPGRELDAEPKLQHLSPQQSRASLSSPQPGVCWHAPGPPLLQGDSGSSGSQSPPPGLYCCWFPPLPICWQMPSTHAQPEGHWDEPVQPDPVLSELLLPPPPTLRDQEPVLEPSLRTVSLKLPVRRKSLARWDVLQKSFNPTVRPKLE